MIDNHETVLKIYREIGGLKGKISCLIVESELCAKYAKSFEEDLVKCLALDVRLAASYPEHYKSATYANVVSKLAKLIDEQHQKVVATSCEIEKTYRELSDKVKAAKEAESEYYKMSA